MDGYIIAALCVYTDIITLFIYILEAMGSWEWLINDLIEY